MNSDLRRKNTTHKKQARTLLEEKSELETQMHEKDLEVAHIKKLINDQEKYDEQRAAVRAAISSAGSEKSIEEEEEPRVVSIHLFL